MLEADIVPRQYEDKVSQGKTRIADDDEARFVDVEMGSDGEVETQIDDSNENGNGNLKARPRQNDAEEGGKENSARDFAEFPPIPTAREAAPQKFKPEGSGTRCLELFVTLTNRFFLVKPCAAELGCGCLP